MYVKTSVRKTRNGEVRYLQLAHNEWDPARGRSVPKVIYGLGREDQLDKEAVRRLVASLSRLLEAGDVPAVPGEGLEFAESRPYGGAYVLDRLWQRLGIGTILTGLASPGPGRPRDAAAAERVLFGLVANRALAPSSKLAAAEWMSRDVHVDGLGEVSDDACYRAMDWLHDVRGELEKQVYFQVADLLNLQVDLLFFDTTSTYFEVGEADEEVPRDWRGEKTAGQDGTDGDQRRGRAGNPAGKPAGFREHGKSKDSRDDLPQIVIGLAVTREGIPVRVWCWPGSTADSALIRQVKKDMRDWSLGPGRLGRRPRLHLEGQPEVPAAGRRRLHHRGEAPLRLRRGAGSPVPAGTLQDRHREPAGQGGSAPQRRGPVHRLLQPGPGRPRRRRPREDDQRSWKTSSPGSDKLSNTKRAELRGKISTMPGLNRFLRVTPGGLLRTDLGKAKAEENLDGKYLLRSADPAMTADDIAAGYKQLLEVERGWRDMKSVLDLRPVYHRLEERIRAHVILCWLALLLIRVAENTASQTWPAMRRELQRIAIGTFTGPAGTFRQRTDIPKTARDLLTALNIDAPRKIHELTTAES